MFLKGLFLKGACSSTQNWQSSNLWQDVWCLERGKSKGIAVNSARFGITANQFSFETGYFVYHFDVLRVESFKLRT